MAEESSSPTNSFTEKLDPTIAAKYYETAASLKLAQQQTEASQKQIRENAQTSYHYNRGNVVRSEPTRFRNLRNAANNAGLAESGQSARGEQEASGAFGRQLGSLAEQRARAIARATLSENQARERTTVGTLGAANTAKAEQTEHDLEFPTAATTVKAASQPNYGQPIPQVLSSKPQKTTNGPRKTAVTKIKKGWGVG